MQKIVWPRSAALLLLALVGGCGGRGPTEPVPAAAGEYDLVAVEGEALPYAFLSTEQERGEIIGGSLGLGADRRYRREIEVRWLLGSAPAIEQSFVQSGTYRETADGLGFTADGGLAGRGTVDGATVTLTFELDGTAAALVYTFRRR